MSYERLIREHDEMEAMVQDIIALTASSHVQAAAASDELIRLATLVSDHLREEDALIYPTIARAMRMPEAEVKGIISAFEELKADWHAYIADWDGECVAGDWEGFRPATMAMLPRLRERVRFEQSMLYSAALQHGIIKLRGFD